MAAVVYSKNRYNSVFVGKYMSHSVEMLLEAALLTSEEALSVKQLGALFEPPLSPDVLFEQLERLQSRWQNRGLTLCLTAQGWRFQVSAAVFASLNRCHLARAPKYSRAVMEILAIIAYQQPVTRSDIESIRGVAVSSAVMQTLSERGWIEVIGQKDVIGRPALWATTPQFLVDLNLEQLADLPPLTELGELVLPEVKPACR